MFENVEYCHDFFGRNSVTYLKEDGKPVGIVVWININSHINTIGVY